MVCDFICIYLPVNIICIPTVCHNLVRTVAISSINFYKLKFSLNYFFKYSLGFLDMKIEFITKL